MADQGGYGYNNYKFSQQDYQPQGHNYKQQGNYDQGGYFQQSGEQAYQQGQQYGGQHQQEYRQYPPPADYRDGGDRRDRGRGYRDRDYGRDKHSSVRGHSSSHHRDREPREREREHHDHRDKERDSKHSERERERDQVDKKDRKHSRSPSPPPRRRKKKSLWDIAPTGFETGQIITPVQLHTSAALTPHQSRQSRRIYVGNLPPGTTETELSAFLTETMLKAGSIKDNNPEPVVAVQMNHEKNFAFVEFTCPEDATAGMGFDGLMYQSHALKVRRPKDYKADEQVAPQEVLIQVPAVPHIVSTNVQEGPNKIFIGGLPSYLNEEQVKQLISAFGPLKSFNLVKDNQTGLSKGFAFFEYLDADITDRACSGLNGMKIGEKNILVQRANIGAKQNKVIRPSEENRKGLLENPTAWHFLNLSMPVAAAASLLGLSIHEAGPPTRVIQICNIAWIDDLRDEDEYDDIFAALRDECQRYGKVVSMEMPKPSKRQVSYEDSWTVPKEINWGCGKAFVEYQTKEEAKKAQQALAGRKFNNRTILCGFFPEHKYNVRSWHPDPEEERRSHEKFKTTKETHDEEEFERARKAALDDIDEMEALREMDRQADERERMQQLQKQQQQQQ